jgi:hypothetical protein
VFEELRERGLQYIKGWTERYNEEGLDTKVEGDWRGMGKEFVKYEGKRKNCRIFLNVKEWKDGG